MNEKKSRALLFILGISIGLLVGATAVYVSTPKPSATGEVSESSIEQIVSKVYSLLSSKREVQDSLISKSDEADKISKSKTLIVTETVPANSKSLVDSTSEISADLSDTLQSDSISSTTLSMVNLNDDIIVKKDELLASKLVELTNLDFSDSKTDAHSDSLLQTLSGIRDDNKMNESKYMYQVELWKSPINYKGYKLAKNKLVLFGVDESVKLKLIYLSDNTYLRCGDAFYKLDNYNDYKAFEKVSNLQLISLLTK